MAKAAAAAGKKVAKKPAKKPATKPSPSNVIDDVTQTLQTFVKSLRLGGVGFYPHSEFVHSDTGRVRYWKGS